MSTSWGQQQAEIEALQAIYGDSFKLLSTSSKCGIGSPHFLITLTNESSLVVLEFIMNSTYPDSLPQINIKSKRNISNQLAMEMVNLANTVANSLKGREMIYEVVEKARDLLENPQPSFHEQMIQRQNRERAGIELERKEAQNKEAMKFEEKLKRELESKHKLKALPDSELSAQTKTADHNGNLDLAQIFLFEPEVNVTTETGNIEIDNIYLVGETGVADWSIVQSKQGFEFSLHIHRLETGLIESPKAERRTNSCVRQISEAIQLSSHPSLINVVGVQLRYSAFEIAILATAFRGTSLLVLLKQIGRIESDRAIVVFMGILNALQHIHRSNFVHKNLTLSSVVISFFSSELQVKIKGVHVEYELDLLQPTKSCLWELPEGRRNLNRRSDIWNFGLICLQVLFGLDVLVDYPDYNSLRKILLNTSWVDFFDGIFCQDQSKRYSATELYQILACLISESTARIFDKIKLKSSSFIKPVKNRNIYSRYEADFEELESLGEGGFGEVLKVRNRVDGRLYAIKRLFLDSEDVEHNRKILREVLALSRLQHDRIVRYYQAWIESLADRELTFAESELGEASLPEDSEETATSFEIEFNSQGEDWMDFGPSLSNRFSQSKNKSLSKKSSSSERELVGEILYIQMEYCPNKTLREYIDEGNLNEDIAWRLLRQIIEGLVYVHSQGIIHRDLKPGNIFLDSAGNAKLGDFGLASTGGNLPYFPNAKGHMSTLHAQNVQNLRNMNLTGGVGTPLYIPPEQSKGSSYNDRADMYSLGIIALELFMLKFDTEMERISIIKEARNHKLPLVIKEDDRYERILTKLLQEDPSERISAIELLKGDYLPARVEDDYVEEAIRTLASPSTPHYPRLISSLFRQVDPYKDFVYDSVQGIEVDLNALRKIIVPIFELRDAVEFYPMNLRIHCEDDDSKTRKQVTMLDEWGQVVELPGDLTENFARYIARCSDEKIVWRRWAIDRIYRPNQPASQPRQLWEIDFDVVFDQDRDIYETVKVIQVGLEVFTNSCKIDLNRLCLVVNHSLICEQLCALFQINSETLEALQNLSFMKRKILLEERGINPQKIIFNNESHEDISRKLFELIKTSEVGNILTRLNSIINFFIQRKRVTVVLDPFLHLRQRRGEIFEILLVAGSNNKKSASEIVAVGGQYDHLIEKYSIPGGGGVAHNRKLKATGIVFAAAKLALLMRPRRVSSAIIVAPSALRSEAYLLMNELWEAGIVCHIEEGPSRDAKVEVILEEKKFRSLDLIKVVSRSNSAVDKKELISNVSRYELISYLKQLEANPISSCIPNIQINFPKNNNLSRSGIRERILRAISPTISVLSGKSILPIQVVVHDLGLSGLSVLLTGGQSLGGTSIVGAGDREEMVRVRDILVGIKSGGMPIACLYSLKDNRVDFMII